MNSDIVETNDQNLFDLDRLRVQELVASLALVIPCVAEEEERKNLAAAGNLAPNDVIMTVVPH